MDEGKQAEIQTVRKEVDGSSSKHTTNNVSYLLLSNLSLYFTFSFYIFVSCMIYYNFTYHIP